MYRFVLIVLAVAVGALLLYRLERVARPLCPIAQQGSARSPIVVGAGR